MTDSPEWDGDGEPSPEAGLTGIGGSVGTTGVSGYSGWSGTTTTTNASEYYSLNLDTNAGWTTSPSIIITYDYANMTWKTTFAHALNLLLGPFLCILSKLCKKQLCFK